MTSVYIISRLHHLCVTLLVLLYNFITAPARLDMTVQGITSQLYSLLSSKLSLCMHTPELDLLVRQLAEVFIMTGGSPHEHTVGYMKGVDTLPTTALHAGRSSCGNCQVKTC